MSASALPLTDVRVPPLKAKASVAEFDIVQTVIRALASLKLTVTLFALAIFSGADVRMV